MSITVTCPNCAAKLKAPDSASGRKTKCPKCGGSVVVPPPSTAHDYEVVQESSKPSPRRAAVAELPQTSRLQTQSAPIGAVERKSRAGLWLIVSAVACVLVLGSVGGTLWATGFFAKGAVKREAASRQTLVENSKEGMSASGPSVTPVADSSPLVKEEPKQNGMVAFDIQGMRIGDRLTEQFAYSRCPAIEKGKPDISCHDSIELNGRNVFISFQFAEFKLVGVMLLFDADAFEMVVDAYTAKFGVPPHKRETAPVSTRMGATYTNVIVLWNTTSGPFTISKYGNSIDKGFGILDSPEYQKYLERKRAEETGKIGGKL